MLNVDFISCGLLYMLLFNVSASYVGHPSFSMVHEIVEIVVNAGRPGFEAIVYFACTILKSWDRGPVE